MKVKELLKVLKTLDQEALVDISSDEEGNSYADIDYTIGEEKRLTGEKCYTLYPRGQVMAEDRYKL